jgi:uncharacterized membrane protein HdeD (DUF308 family)
MTATTEEQIKSYPWWLVLIQGIAAIILGILLVSSTRMTTVILIQFLGLYWLIDGIMSIVQIFLKNTKVHWGWLLARGILGILAGILVLQHPLWSALMLPAVLVIILGVQGLIGGAIGIVQAFKGAGWGAGIIGALSCLFGLILLFNPLIGGLILPYVVGIFAVIGGIAALFMAFKLK